MAARDLASITLRVRIRRWVSLALSVAAWALLVVPSPLRAKAIDGVVCLISRYGVRLDVDRGPRGKEVSTGS